MVQIQNIGLPLDKALQVVPVRDAQKYTEALQLGVSQVWRARSCGDLFARASVNRPNELLLADALRTRPQQGRR